MLNFRSFGNGEKKVFVVHDFFCDISEYEWIWPYLNTEAFTYVFADLRGYGQNKDQEGVFSVEEAAADIIEVVDSLGWQSFAVVGHSMSGLIAQYLAAKHPKRVSKVIGIGPTPPQGLRIERGFYEQIEKACRGDLAVAANLLTYITAGRLGHGFCLWKASRWHAVSSMNARLGYLKMFTQTNIAETVRGCKVPIHVLAGEFETEAHRLEAVQRDFLPLYPQFVYEVIPSASHYPMQETPPFLLASLETALNASC